jgi:hypothetical protein
MKDRSLLDAFEKGGNWWYEDNPKLRIPGRLAYGESGVRLELAGWFQEASSNLYRNLWGTRLNILGILEDGKQCTVLSPIPAEVPTGPVQELAVFASLVANRLCIGAHFKSDEGWSLSSMSVRYSHLERWAGHRGFTVDWATGNGPHRVSIPSVPFELFGVNAHPRKVRISLISFTELTYTPLTRLQCDHHVDLQIAPEEPPQSFEWYHQLLRDCQNLLTLLVGGAVYPTMVNGFKDAAKPVLQGAGSDGIVNIYFRPLRSDSGDTPPSGTIPLSYLHDSIASVFEAWLVNAERLRPVNELLCGTYYHRGPYAEAEFLALMQALEAFHRRERKGAQTSNEQHKWCPLKKRLKELLQEVSDELGLVAFRKRIANDPNQYADVLVNTRNHLTHVPEASEKQKLQGLEAYFRANERLRAVLRFLLLKTTGVCAKAFAAQIFDNCRAGE